MFFFNHTVENKKMQFMLFCHIITSSTSFSLQTCLLISIPLT